MVLDIKTKKILKVFCLVFLVAILTGCAQNLDANGKLIASRAITSSTPWSFDAGWFDFIFVIPLAKGILFINDYVGNVAFGVIGVTIIVNIITLPIMIQRWKRFNVSIKGVKIKLHKCVKMQRFKIYIKRIM